MLVDGTTNFVAKALTQSEAVLDVQFTWESDAPFIADVDDSGMITASRKGKAEITASIEERGIAVSFVVTVHNPIKSIVVEGAGGPYEVGETAMLTAVAYDAAQDDMRMGIEGDPVEGVSFMWASSNTSVATVKADDDDSSMATVTMAGAGSADITAMIGDVTSNKVSFSVFSVVTPERRIVVSTANAPFSRYYHPAVENDPNTVVNELRHEKLTVAKGYGGIAEDGTISDHTVNHSDIVINVTLQYRGLNDDGELAWLNAANGLNIGVASSNDDIVEVDADETITTASDGTDPEPDGAASFTIGIKSAEAANNANVNANAQGDAKMAGRVVITFSETYSADQRVVVTLGDPSAME